MTTPSILDTAVSRIPFGEHDGRSGGSLERVVLADGGRAIVKRTSWHGDIVRQATGDRDGRELRLWRAGVLDRLGVGHAILDGWADGDDTVIVMRDLGDAVFSWDQVLTRDQVAQLLGGMIAVHGADTAAAKDLLVPLDVRIGLMAPARMRPHAAEFPVAAAVVDGWNHFMAIVDNAVAGDVMALLDDPRPLAEAMSRRPCTMIHGDMWPVNTALTDDGPVFLDWGLATWAPPALDVAAFLVGAGAAHLGMSRDEVINEFQRLSGTRADEQAMELALVCGLLDFGWNKALDAVSVPDLDERERHRADLDWWVEAARPVMRSVLP